ncbi:MAG: UDP-N-acetylmuramate dehydrogenase [Betaproteobacteria bacterium]|nr:UDP-N-acetylmuramate dehydrogenase [Betaproteobacteria bacterium]
MAEFQLSPAVDLAPLTTLGVPARAAWFGMPRSLDALREAFAYARTHRLPTLILGGGSNLIFARDYPGLVIKLDLRGREKIGETPAAHLIRVAAGEIWRDTVAWTLAQGWPGLENLALIPGSVGAAPIQNIGAYGLELSERFHSLEAFDPRSGELLSLDRDACRFGYRDSVFKHPDDAGLVVVSVTLALPKRWEARANYRDIAEELGAQGIATPTPQAIFDAVVHVRQRKLPNPTELGNVGSFFKNPVVSAEQAEKLRRDFPNIVTYPQADHRVKLAAAWLIDQAGWKGHVRGHAAVHARQALVLVNLGGASGAEILALAEMIRADVERKFGVLLEQEPITVSHPN